MLQLQLLKHPRLQIEIDLARRHQNQLRYHVRLGHTVLGQLELMEAQHLAQHALQLQQGELLANAIARPRTERNVRERIVLFVRLLHVEALRTELLRLREQCRIAAHTEDGHDEVAAGRKGSSVWRWRISALHLL